MLFTNKELVKGKCGPDFDGKGGIGVTVPNFVVIENIKVRVLQVKTRIP